LFLQFDHLQLTPESFEVGRAIFEYFLSYFALSDKQLLSNFERFG